jgi:Tol biopolymer transport system component
MDSNGSNVRALTKDGHSHTPAWSPDARHILFIHDTALQALPAYRESADSQSHHPVELYVMDRDGNNARLLRRLEPVIYSAAWSPDGRTLAIIHKPEEWTKLRRSNGDAVPAGLFLLSADGQGELRLLFRNAYTPAWSLDGRKLAFSTSLLGGKWTIHVANIDGSQEVELTDPDRISGSPAWSPNGKQIAFDQRVVDANFHGRQQIFVMNADGSGAHQLTTDLNWACGTPSWSPDGTQIVASCVSTAPCGAFGDAGGKLPNCTRRIFSISPTNRQKNPVQLGAHDGATATLAPMP